ALRWPWNGASGICRGSGRYGQKVSTRIFPPAQYQAIWPKHPSVFISLRVERCEGLSFHETVQWRVVGVFMPTHESIEHRAPSCCHCRTWNQVSKKHQETQGGQET